MKKLLVFDKPKKVSNIQTHNKKYLINSAFSGTYVSNITKEDNNKWKGKHIKDEDEHIEIRKTINDVQLLIIVYKNPFQPEKPKFPEYDGGGKSFYWEQANIFYSEDCKRYAKKHQNIKISMNGKLDMNWNDWQDLSNVVKEAIKILS